MAHPREPRKALIAWCLYDWANSAFPTIISTFIFATYFTTAVAPDKTTGTVMWGNTLAVSGVAIAVLAPIMGAISDARGPRKSSLALFTALAVACAALLWFVTPDPSAIWPALILVGLGTLGFELSLVFYNAMLPELAPPGRLGRWSGWGWGLGYLGGLCCLVIALFGLIQADPPPFGLARESAEHIRATTILVALWFALFSLPIFVLVPDRPANGDVPSLPVAVRTGLAQLWRTVRNVREKANANIARYLISRMFYIDGLNTLFSFGGVYAAGTFGMSIDQVILFGIALNVAAGLGAAAFAWVDDWLGSKRTVLLGLGAMIAFGTPLLFVTSTTLFWVFGLALSVFFGPVQAGSRSFMGHLAPPDLRTEMFGLYALSGKVTAFLGPALLAWATGLFDSQRAGMAMVVLLIAAGAIILTTVRAPQAGAASGGSDASR